MGDRRDPRGDSRGGARRAAGGVNSPGDVPAMHGPRASAFGTRERRVSIATMAAPTLEGKLVVAISSRALFDLTESHRIYTELGVESYHRYQIEHEDELLAPGPAFA